MRRHGLSLGLSLGLSVLLHIALLAVLFFQIDRDENPVSIEVIVVDTNVPAAGYSPGASNKEKTATKKRAERSNALKKFVPSYNYGFVDPSHRPGEMDSAGAKMGGSQVLTPDEGIYQRLYRRIEDSLVYPAALAEYQIQGQVKARLKFDETGKLLDTKIEGANSFLRSYIKRFIALLFKNPSPEVAAAKKPIEIECSFRFQLTEHDDRILVALNGFSMGNRLFFYRNRQHSDLQWKFGPFRGMFPVPAVSMDLMWFKEQFEEKKDPLVEFRGG